MLKHHKADIFLKSRLIFRLIGLIPVLFLAAGCSLEKEVQITGKTMGTTYSIKVVTGYFASTADLKKEIDARLVQINKSMSTYDPESEISRFNAMNDSEDTFSPSPDFFHVLKVSRKLYNLTDGAWDGTVYPLINLWGFGKKGPAKGIPDKKAIERLKNRMGFDLIRFDTDGGIGKKKPGVSLDFGSIAKGYGVDQVALLLNKSGYRHFLVEIGGEVYAAGLRKDKHLWKVGINRPDKGAAFDEVYKAISLTGKAMATSGDYRNFFQINGKMYSHIIDPRTGYPVSNKVVSVSVVANNCTVADGLATALMVMGPEKGLNLVNRLDTVECLMIVRDEQGRLKEFPSNHFYMDLKKTG